jgi:hypothetical protein
MNLQEHGQIQLESEFGKSIRLYISQYKPNNIVEIGTWKGLGSTFTAIKAIQESNYKANFISLETNAEFYNIAKDNLKDYLDYVTLILGRIIEPEEIDNFISKHNLDFQHLGWLEEDRQNYTSCPNVFSQIPEQIDLLILDGGEFSTYAEWQILKDRSKIIMLDDTKMLKCKQIVDESLVSPDYYLLTRSDERNGFHVFANKKYFEL